MTAPVNPRNNGLFPHRIEYHPTFGLRVQVNMHERFKVVRIGPDGAYFAIAWKWRNMPVYIDPEYINAFLARRTS